MRSVTLQISYSFHLPDGNLQYSTRQINIIKFYLAHLRERVDAAEIATKRILDICEGSWLRESEAAGISFGRVHNDHADFEA